MSRPPPLAGRPPYATDEPDSVYYDSQQSAQRRVRQNPPPNPNDRTSAYNMYDDYLDHSEEDHPNKHAALAAATHPQELRPAIPLAAPRPGYAAPIAKLNLAKPPPVVTSYARQPQQHHGMQPPLQSPHFSPTSPLNPTPHPLQPPITPIKPVFAAPRTRDSVRFKNQPCIMRGGSEDTLIPKRRQKRDDFWRRFSMVAKEESSKPQSQKESPWLKKTRNGTSRLSRWVWCIGVLFLMCIGGAVALGWWISHNTTGHERPSSLGGSENMTLLSTSTPTAAATHSQSAVGGQGAVATASKKVTPTLTVARRTVSPEPTPSAYLAHRHRLHRRIIS